MFLSSFFNIGFNEGSDLIQGSATEVILEQITESLARSQRCWPTVMGNLIFFFLVPSNVIAEECFCLTMGFLFAWYTMYWAGSPQSGSGYELLCLAALSFHATLDPEASQLYVVLSCTERTELEGLDSVAQHCPAHFKPSQLGSSSRFKLMSLSGHKLTPYGNIMTVSSAQWHSLWNLLHPFISASRVIQPFIMLI